MALQKTIMPISLSKGVDTKTDDKNLVPGSLKVLENMTFKKTNRMDKRKGYVNLGRQALDGTNIGISEGVATFGDELLTYASQSLYSFVESSTTWAKKGDVVSAIIKSEQIVKNNATQTDSDMAVNNGVALTVWADSRGGLRGSVTDFTTGNLLLADVIIDASATASKARVISFSIYLYVVYEDGNSIKAQRLAVADPTSFDVSATLTTDLDTTNKNWDILNLSEVKLCLAYNAQAVAQISLKQFDEDLTDLGVNATVADTADESLTLFEGANLSIYLCFSSVTNDLELIRFNNSYIVVDTQITISSPATAVNNITGVEILGQAQIFYEVFDSNTDEHFIRRVNYDPGVGVDSDSLVVKSVGLFTKAFVYADFAFFGVAHQSALGFQDTYFVYRGDGLLVGKQQYANGSTLVSNGKLQNISRIDNKFIYTLINKTRLISQGDDDVFTTTGVAQTSFDFADINVFSGREISNSLYIVGGILQLYDGANVVEQGFQLFPERVVVGASGAGGVVDVGNHFIQLIYEWHDNKGQVHFSAPSLVYGVITAAGEKVDITFPTLRITSKENVSLVVYMSEVSGSTLYRATSITDPDLNDKTVDSVSITIDISDADLIDNEILYTTGGILPNSAAPACSFIEVFKGRLMLSGLENSFAYNYSKINRENIPLEFTGQFSDIVEAIGGPITAVSTIDDKFFLWKKNRPYYIFGDGPNEAGGGSLFTIPAGINIDVGCDNNQSLVRYPNGSIFKSEKGIYSINSGFQVEYIGSQVEDFNDTLITSAVLKAQDNEIRFTTQDNCCLVYNYFYGQWSTFTNHESNGAIVWMQNYVLLRTDGDIFKEESNSKDDGSPIRMTLETGWISLAGIQGFQRVYRFGILGTYKSHHILKITVSYDFKESSDDVYNFDTRSAMDVTTWGAQDTWGSGAVWGGDDISYFFRAHLSKQKCSSIKFKIEDIPLEGTGESLNITNLALEVGGKGGINRARVSKSIGAS